MHVYVSSRLASMATKCGLITDSFKVVKKARRRGAQEKRPTPPPQKGEEHHIVCIVVMCSVLYVSNVHSVKL